MIDKILFSPELFGFFELCFQWKMFTYFEKSLMFTYFFPSKTVIQPMCRVKAPIRNGSVVILFLFLLPMLIAMTAFAIDYGVIVLADHQMQNAADAGAITAVRLLQEDSAAADEAAELAIEANLVLGESLSSDPVRDIDYGTWNAETNQFTVIARQNGQVPSGASAVRVRLSANDSTANGVRLFFAPFFGTDYANVRGEAIAAISAGCTGFVGIQSASLLNNIRTNSYDSDVGLYGGSNVNNAGDVCSGGPVFLASGAGITGNASGSPVTIAQGSGAFITGSQSSGPPLEFEPVDFSEALPNNNDTIERGPEWAPPFYDSSTNDLVVNNGRSLTLQAGTYYFRDLLLAGGSSLNITGPVEIYIEREMRFDNGTVANQTEIPKNLRLFVGEGPVNIQGGHQLHAVIYAPEATVDIANGSGFFGSIVGRTLSAAGGAGLHYDESLAEESPTTTGSLRLVF